MGGWRDYRGDAKLTGVARGNINSVSLDSFDIIRSFPIAGSYQEVYPASDGSGDIFTVQGGGIQRLTRSLEYKWRSRPFGAHWIARIDDLDGDGLQQILTSNGKDVVLLSAESGEILWSYCVTHRTDNSTPFSYGTYATMFQCERLLPGSRGMQIVVPCFSHKEVLVFDCSGGARHTKLMHKLWMDDAYHPTIAIGDVNGDGKPEIVIARLGGVYVFDPETGKKLGQTQWTTDEERRRNYGHFELCDIDNDGELEAVIVSDRVTRHIAVLDNDGAGNFTPLWDRFIEHIYPNDSTELRYCINSICSPIAADRKMLVVSTFNTEGNERWQTEVIELLSGNTQVRIPDAYLIDAFDGNGDGFEELLLHTRIGRGGDVSGASIVSISNAGHETLWSSDSASFAIRAEHCRGQKGQFKPEVFGSDACWRSHKGDPLIFINSEADRVLCAVDAVSREITELHQGLWMADRVVMHDENLTLLSDHQGYITALTNGGIIETSFGYHLTTEGHLGSRVGTVLTSAAIDARAILAGALPGEVVLYDETFEAFRRLKGRARIGYDNVYHSCPFFETAFGTRCLVTGDGGSRHLVVSLYDLTGSPTHRIELPEFPATSLQGRIGVYDFQYFEHSRGPALYLAIYRSASMNSECSVAVLIGTNEILWHTVQAGTGEFGRGIGPWGTSTLDIVDDKQVVLFCAKDTLVILDLETGGFIREPLLLTDFTKAEMQRQGIFKEQGYSTWSTIDDPFTAYGSVIAQDVNGDGENEYIVAGCFGGFGILDHNFEAIWWKVASFNDVLYRMPVCTDPNGDGRAILVQGHASGKIVGYDAMTGDVVSSLDVGAISTDCIACDIDGCGTAEVITSTNDGRLLVIGLRDRELRILREWQFTSGLGSPSVHSVGGKLMIVVADSMGQAHSISYTG